MIVKITAIGAIGLFGIASSADKARGSVEIGLIKAALKKYQNADAVKIDLKKTIKLALLDEVKKSEGVLTISKGQLRLEILKPELTTLIVTNKLIWLITPAPKELGGKTQVLKITSQSFKKQAKAPLGLLLGRPAAWDQFEVIKKHESESTIEYTLKPKGADVVGEIVGLKVVLDKKSNDLKALTYSDDLENETHFDFAIADFKAKINGESFKYSPAVDAEVTEYK